MSVLSDIQSALEPLCIPIETGIFNEEAPAQYIVLIPLADSFALHADNLPGYNVQEARVSLYSKGNYISVKNDAVRLLISHDFTITDRRYIGYETETGYHHYVVDVAKHYEMEE